MRAPRVTHSVCVRARESVIESGAPGGRPFRALTTLGAEPVYRAIPPRQEREKEGENTGARAVRYIFNRIRKQSLDLLARDDDR